MLRHHAAERPDAVCLEFPDEDGLTYTYAEALDRAEHVASALYRAGAAHGDRVVLMAQNSSQFVRTWWGTAVGGLVEVPINTNYEGEFLRHQLDVAQARFAVIDDVQAERWVAVAEHARMVERFWVVDTGRATATRRSRCSGRTAGRRTPGRSWSEATSSRSRPRRPQDLGAIFYTSGTTGPSKGVAMPFSQLYFFAQIVVSLTRLTPDDVYLTTTPLFHGNAKFMAVYPVIVAGGRAVIRRKFSASRWIDHVRDSGVTVTNFVGVMMDFAWKQPARENDRDNRLRAVYAAPTASTIVDAVQGALRDRGVPRRVRPHRDLRPDHVAVRRAAARGCRRSAERRVVRHPPGRPRDRPRGPGRPGRRARGAPGPPVDLQQRLLQHAGEDRRGLAEPVVPHR